MKTTLPRVRGPVFLALFAFSVTSSLTYAGSITSLQALRGPAVGASDISSYTLVLSGIEPQIVANPNPTANVPLPPQYARGNDRSAYWMLPELGQGGGDSGQASALLAAAQPKLDTGLVTVKDPIDVPTEPVFSPEVAPPVLPVPLPGAVWSGLGLLLAAGTVGLWRRRQALKLFAH